MNQITANYLSFYIDIVILINKNISSLVSPAQKNIERNYKLIIEIIHSIVRIVPMHYDNKNNKLRLDKNNGILQLKSEISDIEKYYEALFNQYEELFDRIRRIRNKYEHSPHLLIDISVVTYTSSDICYLFGFDSEYESSNGMPLCINFDELMNFTQSINFIFESIRLQIVEYAKMNNKIEYQYYSNLNEMSFIN